MDTDFVEDKTIKDKIRYIQNLADDIKNKMLNLSSDKAKKSSPYPIHLALGHEKLAATVAATKDKGDKFVLTHRNIHFNLALSSDIEQAKI